MSRSSFPLGECLMCNRTSTLRRALCNPALWLIGAALLLTAQLAAAQTTYAVGAGQSSQVCGTVDLTTGHWTVLNSYLNYVVGLGQFGGNLYGAIGNGFYELNPANCAFNFVGQGSENFEYGGFGSTTGTNAALYGIDDGDLYSVRANNGSTMTIGPTNLITTSMSANCPVLYVTATESNGNSALYSLNTNTGAASEI